MSDNVNVLIEKMNQESLKKRQAAQQKKYGIHEAKTGGNVYGSSDAKIDGDDDATKNAGTKGAGNSVAVAAYGSGIDGGKSQSGIEIAGGEVIVGDKGPGAKGKAGGSLAVGAGANSKATLT